MAASLKSALKSTKDGHSEETPKTNLKRKRTPGKQKVWTLFCNSKIMKNNLQGEIILIDVVFIVKVVVICMFIWAPFLVSYTFVIQIFVMKFQTHAILAIFC